MVFVRKATSVAEKLAHYASFPQTPVSLHQMVAFGRDPSPGKVLRAAKFLADELPIRLAHRIRDIDNSAHDLGKSTSFATVRNWYLQSFEEISSFPTIKLPPSTQRIFLPTATPNPFNGLATPLDRRTAGSQRRFYVSPTTDGSWTPELLELNSRFIKVLEGVRRRHDPTVYRVAYGVREFLRKAGGNGAQGADEELHNWLDRFYMSRVSMRFLISQHMAISSPQPPPPHHVGIINEQTDIAGVLQDAIDAASFTCEEHYALHRAPRIILNCPSSLQFAYVPGHLNHIAFEILKNALRATVEKTFAASDDEKFPDIQVDVIELPATDQIAIRVSDRGGGIKKEELQMVWRYSYSTVGNEDIMDEDEDGMKGGTVRAPMAGYGYGLPLSRLYARYFGGDLRLESREGEGADATIILNRKACSLEPVH